MTTVSNPLPQQIPAPIPTLTHLNPNILLAIYLISPLVALFVFIDFLSSGMSLSQRISFDNRLMLLIGLLLQTPHAIASMFTFADKEYIAAYKWTLVKCVLIGIGTLGLILAIGDAFFMACLLTYNFYHQCSQQAGIAAMLARNKSRLHETWRWMTIIIQFVSFFAILGRNNPDIQLLPIIETLLIWAAALFLVAFGIVSVLTARQSQTRTGMLMIGAQTLTLYLVVGMFILNLPLLMIIAPVVIHDFTAFAFYINHNTNRNRESRPNVFSRLRNIIPMPEYLLTPALGLIFGSGIFLFGESTFIYAIFAILVNVIHIYLEGKMWKSGSPHRQYTFV